MKTKGFTLVELIIVIVIGGILATMISTMIARPIEGFVAASRRAELVDMAENAVRRMQRDVRNALPNSVRIDTTGRAIEFINVRDAGRYRVGADAGNSDPACLFSHLTAESSFGIFTGLPNGAIQAGDRLVISNWNSSGTIANAYSSTDNISPASTTINLGSANPPCSEPYLTLSTPFLFQYLSPQQRFYLVDTPITYLCDVSSGTLTRYWNYPITNNQANVDTDAELLAQGAQSAVVAIRLGACNFSYISGTNTGQRSGVATLSLLLSQSGESISLLHQVHVDNLP